MLRALQAILTLDQLTSMFDQFNSPSALKMTYEHLSNVTNV